MLKRAELKASEEAFDSASFFILNNHAPASTPTEQKACRKYNRILRPKGSTHLFCAGNAGSYLFRITVVPSPRYQQTDCQFSGFIFPPILSVPHLSSRYTVRPDHNGLCHQRLYNAYFVCVLHCSLLLQTDPNAFSY